MKTPKRRSTCPVACTLDVLGDRWTLLVIRDLMAGKSHFNEFTKSPEGIATNILTERLRRLETHGLVEQHPSDQRTGTFAYRLTDRGRSLLPVLAAMRDWGLAHVRGTKANIRVDET